MELASPSSVEVKLVWPRDIKRRKKKKKKKIEKRETENQYVRFISFNFVSLIY